MFLSTRQSVGSYRWKNTIFFDPDHSIVWCYHSCFTGKRTVAQRSSERLSYMLKVTQQRQNSNQVLPAPESTFLLLSPGTAKISLISGSQNRPRLSVTSNGALIPWQWPSSREGAAQSGWQILWRYIDLILPASIMG